MKEKEILSEMGNEVTEAFAAHRRDELKKPIAAFGIEIKSKFLEALNVSGRTNVLEGIRDEKKYTFTTMRKLCYIKLFLSYVNGNHTRSYKSNKNILRDGFQFFRRKMSDQQTFANC